MQLRHKQKTMSLYTTEKKICEAAFPRHKGSTAIPHQRLSIVYLKYKTTAVFKPEDIKINLVFAHGTGMNKSVWKYHINKLFEAAKAKGWPLDLVISIDAIQLGDSGLLNNDKIGWLYYWADGARDVNNVVRHEQNTTGDFIQDDFHKNIAIGHSIGGYQVTVASYYEPEFFSAIIPIEPVIYSNPSHVARFIKVFKKLGGLILDSFDLLDDVNTYFRELSFYRNTKPEILDDFLEDEIYLKKGDEPSEVKYNTKCTRENQMVSYISSAISLTHSMDVIPLLQNRVYHTIGTEAAWNPPEAITWFREHINPELLTAIDLPGEHLLNIEKPDQMIDTIAGVIDTETEHYKKALLDSPFLKSNDPSKAVDGNKERLFQGEVDNVDFFKVVYEQKSTKNKL